jgi:surface antigen
MRRSTTIVGIVLALALAPGAAVAKGKPDHAGKPKHAEQSPGGGPPHAKDDGHGHNDHGRKGGPGGPPNVRRVVSLKGGGPPPWAPAHGYRRNHGGGGGGNAGHYEVPFGFDDGFCKRDAVAAAIGAVGGGAVAGAASDGDPVAIAAGMLGGALLGTVLSKSGDPVDRGCFGQALEHAPSHKAISWRNPKDDTAYRFTPLRTFETDDGRWCRDYANVVTVDGRERTERGTACRDADGTWR